MKGFAGGRSADGSMVALDGRVHRSLTISSTGFYGATNLPVGAYTLTVVHRGKNLAIAAVTVNAGMVTTADFDKLPVE